MHLLYNNSKLSNLSKVKFVYILLLSITGLSCPLLAEQKKTVPSSGKTKPTVQVNTPEKLSSRDLFTRVCANCHGKKGEGSAPLKAPSIAGLPKWYVQAQIEKFHKQLRGISIDDPEGQIMHNIVTSIDIKQSAALAEIIAALPMLPTQNTLGGNEKTGKEVFMNTCAKCHRFNGKGEIVFGSAPLIGLQDWYIRSQLLKFRKGIRGGNPEDEKGHKMHEISQYLSDEQAVDVTAYIAILAKKYANTNSRREREFEEIQKRRATPPHAVPHLRRSRTRVHEDKSSPAPTTP